MSLNDEEKQSVVAYRLEKASKTLDDAKKVIELELWATAANRLYYAAYYAVSALLIAKGLNAKTHDGIIRLFNTAPMPGTVLAVKVAVGQSVKKGETVVLLEAMKMENEIPAPRDGVIASIAVNKGASVQSGDLLLSLK